MKFQRKRFEVKRGHGFWYAWDRHTIVPNERYVLSDGSLHDTTYPSGTFKSRKEARLAKALAEAKHGVF